MLKCVHAATGTEVPELRSSVISSTAKQRRPATNRLHRVDNGSVTIELLQALTCLCVPYAHALVSRATVDLCTIGIPMKLQDSVGMALHNPVVLTFPIHVP